MSKSNKPAVTTIDPKVEAADAAAMTAAAETQATTIAEIPAVVEALADPVVTPAPAVEPVVTQTAAPVVIETQAFPKVTGIAEIDKVLKDVPAANLYNVQRVVEYVDAMAPKRPISAEAGAVHQKGLYNAIVNTINFDEQYFEQTFTAILRLFEAHKDGVFHETHVWRFFDVVALSKDDQIAFQRLLSLIQVLGPVKGRAQAMKQFDFKKALEYRLNDAGRQRLQTYFNV